MLLKLYILVQVYLVISQYDAWNKISALIGFHLEQ